MPYITIRVPSPSQNVQPTYPVNIDFDEASRAWRIHTQADNPRALRSRQRAYWAKIRKRPTRACVQARQTKFKQEIAQAVKGTAKDPIILAVGAGPRRSRRQIKAPKRLINEC